MNDGLGRSPVSAGDQCRLEKLLRAAAFGSFPAADGAVEVVPPPPGPADAIVAFTAHHVIAADVDLEWVAANLPPDDLGAPMNAVFLATTPRRLETRVGALDVVLAATAGPGRPDLGLVPAEASFEHARLDRARRYRRDVHCLRDDRGGLLTVGRGLAGRVEVSIEVDPTARRAGLGASLAGAALGLAARRTGVRAGLPGQRRLPALLPLRRLPADRRRGPLPAMIGAAPAIGARQREHPDRFTASPRHSEQVCRLRGPTAHPGNVREPRGRQHARGF